MIIGHRIFGEGPEKVVVLHGWHMDHSVFEPMFPALDGQKFSYAFVDYRGYGLSKEMKGEHTIQEIGLDAIRLASHLKWERFHLIGHSMGGMAVQWIMTKANERIKSTVAITPVPASGVPFQGEELELFENAAKIIRNREIILMGSTGNRHCEAWGRTMTQRSVETTTPDAFADYFRAWSRTNFVSEVEGLKTPIKVIVGEHDFHLTPEVMKQTFLKWYPNAELEVLRNSGHYPMLEVPINLATVCEHFMWLHK